MNILLTGTEIYEPSYPETKKNQCGFGIMMRQLADMLSADENHVDIIMQSNFTKGRMIGKARLYRKTFLDLFLHFKAYYVIRAIKVMRMKDLKFPYKLRTLLYFLTGAYIEDIIKKNKYDCVHINGIGNGTIPIMYACVRTNTPFLLTLHGVISFSEKTSANIFSKKMERIFFKETNGLDNIYTSIVGTGGKKKLETAIGSSIKNMYVICNPLVKINENIPKIDKTNIAKHIILCVGNITEQKNQKMVIDAFILLDDKIKEDTKLIFIGSNKEMLSDYVVQKGEKNIIFTGALPRAEVEAYYRISDVFITASIDEGFGLPVIEAYSNGVPCIIPEQIDAFIDLYEQNIAIKVTSYKTELFRDAIIEALNKKWDKQTIRNKAKEFEYNNCKTKYLELLNKVSKVNKCCLPETILDEIYNLSIK